MSGKANAKFKREIVLWMLLGIVAAKLFVMVYRQLTICSIPTSAIVNQSETNIEVYGSAVFANYLYLDFAFIALAAWLIGLVQREIISNEQTNSTSGGNAEL